MSILKNEFAILLSYPRSGNTFFRNAIEYITNRRTYPNSKSSLEFREKNNLKNMGKYILYKEHSLYDKANDFKKAIVNCENIYHKGKLIFLLRNYKEILIRQHSHSKNIELLFHDNPKKQIFNYMENLIEYDKWPEKNKLLIYYEDLITKPIEIFKETMMFLNIKDDIEPFIKNYNSIFDSSIKAYGENASSGKETIYHSKHLTDEQKKSFDKKIKNKYPKLFDKYLCRYKENF